MNETVRVPLNIDVSPYLMDHYYDGKAVLPAVEIMHSLALTTKNYLPDTDITSIENASFDKFLYIPEDTIQIIAFNEISVHKNGNVSAKLMTKNRVKDLPITRIKEHAVLTFSQSEKEISTIESNVSTSSINTSYNVSSEKIYRELVPFGPSYHNISGLLKVNNNEAFAKTNTNKNLIRIDRSDILGSPFPLDAAFHAACVWGQRYKKIIAFPVGINKRVVLNPTMPGSTYNIHVDPIKIKKETLIFNIIITDESGVLYESVSGLIMKDVRGGRMKPPEWIVSEEKGNS